MSTATDLKALSKKLSLQSLTGRWQRLKISVGLVFWTVMAIIVSCEIFALYMYAYKNSILTDEPALPQSKSIVRVNLEQYNNVVERLDRVQFFSATSTIDIIGDNGVGRSNPFADPQ